MDDPIADFFGPSSQPKAPDPLTDFFSPQQVAGAHLQWKAQEFGQDLAKNIATPRRSVAMQAINESKDSVMPGIKEEFQKEFPGMSFNEDAFKQGVVGQFQQEKLNQAKEEMTRPGPGRTQRWLEWAMPRAGGTAGDIARTALHAFEETQAAKRINNDTASWHDYLVMGRKMADEEREQAPGVGRKIFDVATQLPATALEWITMGGPAGALAKGGIEKAGSLVANKAASWALRQGAKAALEGGARTAMELPKYGAIGEAESATPGGPTTSKAIATHLANGFIQNVVFSAAPTFGTGETVGQRLAGAAAGIGGIEAAGEFGRQVGVNEQGSSVRQMIEGKPHAWEGFVANAVAFLGMEAGMHAANKIRAKYGELKAQGLKDDSPKMQVELQKTAQEAVDEAKLWKEPRPPQGGVSPERAAAQEAQRAANPEAFDEQGRPIGWARPQDEGIPLEMGPQAQELIQKTRKKGNEFRRQQPQQPAPEGQPAPISPEVAQTPPVAAEGQKPARERILDAFHKLDVNNLNHVSIAALAKETGMDVPTIQTFLYRMRQEGTISLKQIEGAGPGTVSPEESAAAIRENGEELGMVGLKEPARKSAKMPAEMETVDVRQEIAKLKSELAAATNPIDKAFIKSSINDHNKALKGGKETYQRPLPPPDGYESQTINGKDFWVLKEPKKGSNLRRKIVTPELTQPRKLVSPVTPEEFRAENAKRQAAGLAPINALEWVRLRDRLGQIGARYDSMEPMTATDLVHAGLDQLTADVLIARRGSATEKPKSFRQLADELGISHEQVRLIEKEGRRQLSLPGSVQSEQVAPPKAEAAKRLKTTEPLPENMQLQESIPRTPEEKAADAETDAWIKQRLKELEGKHPDEQLADSQKELDNAIADATNAGRTEASIRSRVEQGLQSSAATRPDTAQGEGNAEQPAAPADTGIPENGGPREGVVEANAPAAAGRDGTDSDQLKEAKDAETESKIKGAGFVKVQRAKAKGKSAKAQRMAQDLVDAETAGFQEANAAITQGTGGGPAAGRAPEATGPAGSPEPVPPAAERSTGPGAEPVQEPEAGTRAVGGGGGEQGVEFGPPAIQQPERAGTVSPFKINATIERLFDLPVYTEKELKNKAQALYRNVPELAEVSKMAAAEPGYRLHELAHHLVKTLKIDLRTLPPEVTEGFKQFDYDKRARRVTEGFAEWLRRREMDDLDNLSPQQLAAFRYAEHLLSGEKGVIGKLDRVREQFRNIDKGMGGLISKSGIPEKPELKPNETVADYLNRTAESGTEKLLDDLIPLKRAEYAVERKGEKFRAGTKLSEIANVTRFKTAPDANEMENGGVFGYDPLGNPRHLSEPLSKAVSDLSPGEVAKGGEFDQYVRSLAILHDVTTQTVQHAPEHIEAAREFVNGIMGDRQKLLRFEASAKRITAIYNATLDALAVSGRLSPDHVEALKAKYPFYVSLTRIPEQDWYTNRERMGFVKKRTGSGEQMLNWIDALRERYRITAAIQNEQMKFKALLDLASREGAGEFVNKGEYVPGDEALGADTGWNADSNRATIIGFADGRPIRVRVKNEQFYKAYTDSMGEGETTFQLVKGVGNWSVGRAMGGVVRKGFTILQPFWHLKNFVRDPILYIQRNTAADKWPTGTNWIKNGADLAQWYAKSAQFFAKALLSGGAERIQYPDENFLLYNRLAGREQRYLQRRSDVYDGWWGLLGRIAQRAEDLVTFGEIGTRVLESRNVLDRLGYTKDVIQREMAKPESSRMPLPFHVQVAMLDAAGQITHNTHQMGYYIRELNKSMPFLGAHIAGVYKDISNFRAQPQKALSGIAILAAAKSIEWLLNKDDKEWNEFPDYLRYGFSFKTPMGWVHLPAPRGVSAVITSLIGEMMRWTSDNNPQFAGALEEGLRELAPSGGPEPFSTAAHLAANQNWIGAPIAPPKSFDAVSRGGETRLERYRDYYAPYVAGQLSGGILSGKEHSLIPFGMDQNPHRSVDEFYSLWMRTPKTSAAYEELNKSHTEMSALNREYRAAKTASEKRNIRQQQVKLARDAIEQYNQEKNKPDVEPPEKKAKGSKYKLKSF